MSTSNQTSTHTNAKCKVPRGTSKHRLQCVSTDKVPACQPASQGQLHRHTRPLSHHIPPPGFRALPPRRGSADNTTGASHAAQTVAPAPDAAQAVSPAAHAAKAVACRASPLVGPYDRPALPTSLQ
mmetsp:Transcript_43194/g.107921  ORF Transcript_43194/g.107921 Transcript_43194/m.107921 type:complete len:126 (+) Transcript_43194:86-463(+)